MRPNTCPLPTSHILLSFLVFADLQREKEPSLLTLDETFSRQDALLEKTVGTETVLTTLDGIFSLFGALQGIAIQAVLVGWEE